MSDFKKSKKPADSKRATHDTEIDSLVEEIDLAEQEAEEQIQILETKMKDIQGLQKELESVFNQLGQIEGEALQVAQENLNLQMEKKQDEADECRYKLEEIKEEMQHKQSEISNEIIKRDEVLSELGDAEKECHADLSEAKEAVNTEKQTLQEANNKILQILSQIDTVLTDKQAEKKTEYLKNFVERSLGWVGESFREAAKTGKNIQTTLMMGTMLYGGMLTKRMEYFVEPIKEINNGIVAPMASKNSGFSIIKETENTMHEKLGINSEFQKLETSREPDKKRRKRESEISGEVSNQPGSSGKK